MTTPNCDVVIDLLLIIRMLAAEGDAIAFGHSRSFLVKGVYVVINNLLFVQLV